MIKSTNNSLNDNKFKIKFNKIMIKNFLFNIYIFILLALLLLNNIDDNIHNLTPTNKIVNWHNKITKRFYLSKEGFAFYDNIRLKVCNI